MKKKSKNLGLPPRRALLGHPVQKYFKFFCFNKKNWDPLGPLYNQKKKSENFYIWSVGCVEFISEGIFGKCSKIKIFFLRSNFDAFFRPSNLKTENLLKKN